MDKINLTPAELSNQLKNIDAQKLLDSASPIRYNFQQTPIQKIPEKFIPACLMNWMEHYTNKRISELKQQIIRNRWHTVELEKVVDNIHNRQQS